MGRGRAFTLVELVLALGLTTIVVGASAAVMMVASRALPSSSDASVVSTDAASGMAMLEAELQCATRVRLAASSVAMMIPDRTGDGVAERILYAWSGVAGDPLERTEGGVTTSVIGGVRGLAFSGGRARGSGTRIGVVYVSITLEGGLETYSTIRTINEPENNL